MLYGVFSYQDNVRRLESLDRAIARARREGDLDVAELEADRRELLGWFRDVERFDP